MARGQNLVVKVPDNEKPSKYFATALCKRANRSERNCVSVQRGVEKAKKKNLCLCRMRMCGTAAESKRGAVPGQGRLFTAASAWPYSTKAKLGMTGADSREETQAGKKEKVFSEEENAFCA